jgi:hypothetical protein
MEENHSSEDWTETIENMPKEDLIKGLIMAIGALSTTEAFANKTPDQVFDWLFYLMNYRRIDEKYR